MKIHPTFHILYILLISILVFSYNNIQFTLALLLLQLFLWLLKRIPIKEFRRFKKILSFSLTVLFFHTFFSGREVYFVLFSLFGFKLQITTDGFFSGLLMLTKLITMLSATFLVRLSISSNDFKRGLRGLGLSNNLSQILDFIFETIEANEYRKGDGSGGGRGKKQADKSQEHSKGSGGREPGSGSSGGKGDGSGGGQGKRENKNEASRMELAGKKLEESNEEKKTGITIKGVLKGDFQFFIDLIHKHLERAKQKFSNHDLVLLATFTLIVALIRFIKIAPGFPIAPGHKNVVLIPFFILAARMTKMTFAATRMGFLSGVIHFMSGFGKYGPFGILEFIVLGIVIDLLNILTFKSNSLLAFAFIGLVAGFARVTALITISFLVDMPLEFFVVYSPLIIAQCSFGMLSALVTKYLVKHLKEPE